MKNKSVDKHIFQEAFDLMNSERNSVFLHELENKISEAVLKTKGIEEALLYSAVELSKDEKNKFEKTIFQILKHEVKVNYRIEPKLLGGLRIHLGDWKIDGTLIYQLERLKRSLGGN